MSGSATNPRLFGTERWKLLVAAALGSFAVLVGSAHGRLGASVGALPGFDGVFAMVDALLAPAAPSDLVDLGDGRSRVEARWRAHFERFAQDDRNRLPVAGGVVFTGSSSIEFWNDLPAQFPTHAVVQRGLAGGTMADCARHVDRLILPYRPRVVVVYAGDNDLAAGVAPEQIVAEYADLVGQVHRALPATRVVFVSIKPSLARGALTPLVRRTNALMAAYTRTDRSLDFVDVFTPMLDRNAQARSELFGPDGLHLNRVGYALWRDAIVHHLD